MNLTPNYRNITTPSSKRQMPTHVEHVPTAMYEKDNEKQQQKLKKLFPILDEESSQDSYEPTVYVDRQPLVDELV